MIWTQNIIIILGACLLLGAIRWVWVSKRWERSIEQLKRDLTAKICALVIGLYCFIGVLGSIEIPKSDGKSENLLDLIFKNVQKEKTYSEPWSTHSFAVNKPEPLKGFHLWGTNSLGKDVLVECLKACRTALFIGGLTSLILIPLGAILGIAAGYFKGWVDDLIQYAYSTVSSIPHILFLIAIMMVLGKGVPQMCIALSLTSWVGLCRLIRGETMRQSGRPYIEAARALGQSHWKIIIRHLLPNVMPLILINFVLGFSGLVMSETILSYLGVGVPIGVASWGVMIDSARMELAREPSVWWNLLAASISLFFLVLPLNLLGDSLRKAFDPKSK